METTLRLFTKIFLGLLLISHLICIPGQSSSLEDDDAREEIIVETNNCLTYFLAFISSKGEEGFLLPGGGQLRRLQDFCSSEENIPEVQTCLRRVSENYPNKYFEIKLNKLMTDLIALKQETCSNIDRVADHHHCYRKSTKQLSRCSEKLDNYLKKHPLTDHKDVMDLVCRATSVTVSCDIHHVGEVCGYEVMQTITPYLTAVNLWPCPVLNSSQLFVGMTSPANALCQADVSKCIPTQLTGEDESHVLYMLTFGHLDDIKRLCRYENELSSCVTEATKICNEHDRTSTTLKYFSQICQNMNGYEGYSQNCRDFVKKDTLQCWRDFSTPSPQGYRGDTCSQNRLVANCFDTAARSHRRICEEDLSILSTLSKFHHSRIPSACGQLSRFGLLIETGSSNSLDRVKMILAVGSTVFLAQFLKE